MANRNSTQSGTSQSSFQPQAQVENIESKTIAALERVSEAFRVLLWRTGKEYKLSPIAVQILTFLRFHAAELCTVGYLAQEFNMTKQTVSEAVVTLESRGFVEKKTSPDDARSMLLVLTQQGKTVATSVSQYAAPLETTLRNLPSGNSTALLNALMELIRTLNEAGIVQTQRMCYTCRFYVENHLGNPQYCTLLGQALLPYDASIDARETIRLDCEEHEAIEV